MVWLKALYQPTALFSLRPSWTTSTGGKTLLLASPYAIKMAILDVALRTSGHQLGEAAWPWIRDLAIGVQLPAQIVVTNLFAKVLKLRRNPANPGSVDVGPFQRTIGYREYVYHPDPIGLLFNVPEKQEAQLRDWLIQVNYLGKRGGFVQLLDQPQVITELQEHVLLTAESPTFPLYGVVQQLDDCDPKMKFAEADIYDSKRPKRLLRHIILPYRLKRSSRSYSWYEYSGG
jgi:hypothetical protein